MRLINWYKETISDGPGLRCSLYLSGCEHACPGCHNPKSWDANAGVLLTDELLTDIIAEIKRNPLLDGITISGGDPFYNAGELEWLVLRLKQETGMNIWCYTGYTIEYLLTKPDARQALRYIDTLVDGPFVARLRDPHLAFVGSSNQRVLRVADFLSD